MKRLREMKLAFVGVSHWHLPFYLAAIEKECLTVVGVSDDNEETASFVAKGLGCRSYSSAEALLDTEKPDFVFAFAQHDRLPALALELIRRNIAFSIEKPLGLHARDVEEVLTAAERQGTFCAIPFVWRYSPLIQDFYHRTKPDDLVHLSLRFIVGAASRYREGSPWMLRKETAGGGCMTNLGVHFIDLALFLGRCETAQVKGASFHYLEGHEGLEDYASALLSLPTGASAVIETGYTYPGSADSKRDCRCTFATKQGYETLGPGFFESRKSGSAPVVDHLDTNSDGFYALYTIQSLREYAEGKPPSCGLADMLHTRRVLDAMIEKARS